MLNWVLLGAPFVAAVLLTLIQGVAPGERFRASRLVTLVLTLATCAGMLVVLVQPGVVVPNILGASTVGVGADAGGTAAIGLTPLARLALFAMLLLVAVSMVAAYATDNLTSGRFAPATLTVVGAVAAALSLTNPFLVTLCLTGAAILAIIGVVDGGPGLGLGARRPDDDDGLRDSFSTGGLAVGSQQREGEIFDPYERRFARLVRAAFIYLIATVFFGLLFFLALILLERLRLDPQQVGLIKVITAFIGVGFATRFGIFPFNLWLPAVLEIGPSLAAYIAVGFINVAGAVFLVNFLQANPTLLLDNRDEAQYIMALGMAGALAAGLLALGQNGIGKLVAYATSATFGLALFSLASPHPTGKIGAVYTMMNFGLVLLLVLVSMSVVYFANNNRPFGELTGLARRAPVAAFGLAVGLLGMAGLPMLSGFAGTYLVLQAAALENPVWAVLGGLALALFLIAGLRAYHRTFMGEDVPGLVTRPEPPLATIVIIGLVAAVIYFGLFPSTLVEAIQTALNSAT